MTVQHLRESMTNQEFVQWQAFFNYRKTMQDLATKETT